MAAPFFGAPYEVDLTRRVNIVKINSTHAMVIGSERGKDLVKMPGTRVLVEASPLIVEASIGSIAGARATIGPGESAVLDCGGPCDVIVDVAIGRRIVDVRSLPRLIGLLESQAETDIVVVTLKPVKPWLLEDEVPLILASTGGLLLTLSLAMRQGRVGHARRVHSVR